jgi:hypothetical protein
MSQPTPPNAKTPIVFQTLFTVRGPNQCGGTEQTHHGFLSALRPASAIRTRATSLTS